MENLLLKHAHYLEKFLADEAETRKRSLLPSSSGEEKGYVADAEGAVKTFDLVTKIADHLWSILEGHDTVACEEAFCRSCATLEALEPGSMHKDDPRERTRQLALNLRKKFSL